jgi:hypothetical protein
VNAATVQDELVDHIASRKEDEEALCAVCSGGLSVEPNFIVFCERCDLAVHQQCYGIEEIPPGGPPTVPLTGAMLPCRAHLGSRTLIDGGPVASDVQP